MYILLCAPDLLVDPLSCACVQRYVLHNIHYHCKLHTFCQGVNLDSIMLHSNSINPLMKVSIFKATNLPICRKMQKNIAGNSMQLAFLNGKMQHIRE